MRSNNISVILRKFYSSYTGLSFTTWQGITISFIESTLIGVCYFLSIYFVTELHLDIDKAGLIISFYGLGTILGGMAGGKLSDLISPRNVTIGSILLQACAYFFLINAQSQSLLMAILFILGAGSYSFITSNYVSTLASCKKNDRLKAINLLDVVSNLGLALSGIIIGSIPTKSFPSLFFLVSCLLFLAGILFFILRKNDRDHHYPQNTIHEPDTDRPNSKIIYFALGCLFCVGLIISQVNSTYPIYLKLTFPEMGSQSFGILFTLNAVLIVLFQAPVINSLGHINKILLIGTGAFLLGIGMFLLNIAYTFQIAIFSCLIMTTGEMLFFPVAQFICYENGPSNKKGHSLGTYRTVYASSRIVGPAIGGFIYQHAGSDYLWTFCFIIGLLCLSQSCYFKKYTTSAMNS